MGINWASSQWAGQAAGSKGFNITLDYYNPSLSPVLSPTPTPSLPSLSPIPPLSLCLSLLI